MSQKLNLSLPIPFIDLKSQQAQIRPQINEAFQGILDHGAYIMGPQIFDLEKKLSEFCGAKHTITCANGTDALALILMAKNVKPGDAVFVPSFTFAATAEVVAWMGATPVFIDVLKDTFNMDPLSLKQGIKHAKELGLNPTAIIPVDLFGAPADYDALETIAAENHLWVLADSAQSFGATYKNRSVGTFGLATSTSFFPAKPLGCYGDGGAIFTDNDDLAEILISLRVHGQGKDKYDNIHIGMNGRLDTLQAAVLLEKLKIFPNELIARQHAADFYTRALSSVATPPLLLPNTTSSWAQYTLRLNPETSREKLIQDLQALGIPTAIYYVKPLHQQKAYQHYPTALGHHLPNSEALAHEVLSLPMHGYLTEDVLQYITESLVHLLSRPPK
ncbi:MAG: aminotransferase DegT [Alphaproteobacteria bacterium 16-39-46]|nr:MAG: aminotransferase DegT [Alphaproteobacteria bacterium 16-39-46]OZA44403.1 MAG: aminotransferase DegT [Alphaproteobacteria bacterium 17-39-52]HQS83288.1 DegT/DnrJ/EryC1/StrS aminotransferase family protein [Alphaproteobacteria bacterium]HQS93170.1 DegT/DnrJ/EryC1/StrS aminotransferase family protein [Alphaproteobacteria bacterium]